MESKKITYTAPYVLRRIRDHIEYHDTYGEPISWTINSISTVCDLYKYHARDLAERKTRAINKKLTIMPNK
jgi:hypothetical protein